MIVYGEALHISFYKLLYHNSHNLSIFKSAAKLSIYKTRINLLLLGINYAVDV